MNFATCRNCPSCKYRGYKDFDPYCEVNDVDISEIKKCPKGNTDRNAWGEEVGSEDDNACEETEALEASEPDAENR